MFHRWGPRARAQKANTRAPAHFVHRLKLRCEAELTIQLAYKRSQQSIVKNCGIPTSRLENKTIHQRTIIPALRALFPFRRRCENTLTTGVQTFATFVRKAKEDPPPKRVEAPPKRVEALSAEPYIYETESIKRCESNVSRSSIS